jgi:small subunit ribosomal protein S9
MAVSKNYFYALGRRKTATARARLFTGGKGTITINNQTSEEYLSNSTYLENELRKPFELLEKLKDFDVTILVSGGGLNGQVEACRLAIAKSLVTLDETNRGTLKKAGLLKRDSREKERKKFGLKRARKAEQYTKR